MKVSSRTLHIAWDDAGCLCPIGDLFNYAAPDDASLEGEDTAEVTICHQKNQISDLSERLTDGGYEDDSAYCLYARKNYRKGEQVYYQSQHCHITFLFFFFLLRSVLYTSAIFYRSFLVMEHTQTWNFLSTMALF
jgi:hypothetical protein